MSTGTGIADLANRAVSAEETRRVQAGEDDLEKKAGQGEINEEGAQASAATREPNLRTQQEG
jgi:hypothetical protein